MDVTRDNWWRVRRLDGVVVQCCSVSVEQWARVSVLFLFCGNGIKLGWFMKSKCVENRRGRVRGPNGLAPVRLRALEQKVTIRLRVRRGERLTPSLCYGGARRRDKGEGARCPPARRAHPPAWKPYGLEAGSGRARFFIFGEEDRFC